MNDIDFDELDRAVSSTLTPAPASEPTPAPSTPPVVTTPPVSPAARRGGRFMDVVHPSSDMKNVSSVPARPVPVPTVSQPAVETPAAVSEPTPAPVNDWPDPIESPFLADTKVEKRPLGGEQPTTEATEPAVEIPEEALEAEIIPTVTEPSAPEAVVPVDEPLSVTEPTSEPEGVSEPTLPPEPEALVVAPVTETHQSAPVGDGGVTSIPQQYTEQPSTAEATGSMYDTEVYHQPLAHPQKKKSGLLVVLWILGLIILGAGLGAVMYFFVLPVL